MAKRKAPAKTKEEIKPVAHTMMSLQCARCGSRVPKIHGGMIRPRNCPIPGECTFEEGALYAVPSVTLDKVGMV
jgi:hypothetical protein